MIAMIEKNEEQNATAATNVNAVLLDEMTHADIEALRMDAFIHKRLTLVYFDPAGRQSNAAHTLTRLWQANALPHFEEVFCEYIPENALGNCHDVSFALMGDLIIAGASYGWEMATGMITSRGENIRHSWLEYGEWGIDATKNICRIVHLSEFYKTYHVRGVSYRNTRKFIKHINNVSRKERDNIPIASR